MVIGAEGFAERSRRELLATGERVRSHTADTRAPLTAREAQIARLAGDGLSNPEIAARLFMSPRTEYHLHKVFTELDISSATSSLVSLPGSQAGVQARDFADANRPTQAESSDMGNPPPGNHAEQPLGPWLASAPG